MILQFSAFFFLFSLQLQLEVQINFKYFFPTYTFKIANKILIIREKNNSKLTTNPSLIEFMIKTMFLKKKIM